MSKFYTYFLVILIVISCNREISQKDKTNKINFKLIDKKFSIGDGLINASIIFKDNGVYERTRFCDICPISKSFGYYSTKKNQIILTDTISFTFELTKPKDTSFLPLKNDTLYYFYTYEEVLSELNSQPKLNYTLPCKTCYWKRTK